MRRPERARLVAAAAFAPWLTLAACNDTRDFAPPDPASPWQTEVATADGAAVHTGAAHGRYDLPPDRALPAADPHPAVDPHHRYSLVELIDIAQANNKQTRIAWEMARQAAIGVGISRAAFLPAITLSALGGYRRMTEQEPTIIAPKGYITANAVAAFPSLTISYLLVDFGARDAATRAAVQASYAANIGFTAAHQEVILEVSRAFFTLQATEAALASANDAMANAKLLEEDARAQFRRGTGTVTDAQDADRGVAEARYGIASATAGRNSARDTLLAALGLTPGTALQVAALEDTPVPPGFGATLDDLMHEALSQRPDLLADLARLRASEARVVLARTNLLPTVSLSAKGSGDIGRISVDQGPTTTFIAPEAGVYLDFHWTLYEGGLLANKVRLAQSEAAEARDTLEQAEDNAMREVAVAYDELDASLKEYDAARALHDAAALSFRSHADSFGHGVGTLTDADTAETALDHANATLVRTHAQVLASAAGLAFATGGLTDLRP